jgi:tRNA (guanine37-N1)-methyltransferase
MQFDILTLFPEMFVGPLTESILKRAQQAGLLAIRTHNIRDWATDKHHTCDDAPYGGGAGMVMKAAPLAAAIRAVLASEVYQGQGDKGTREQQESETLIHLTSEEKAQYIPLSYPVILLTPDGELFSQAIAQELAAQPRLVLVCGHYEGLDERVRATMITREISIGDYVLTGGELAAMVLVDAVARLVPGVLDAESTLEESHSDGLLEYPHYTRPAIWEDMGIPPVLVSGHHGEVAKWRRRERLRRTLARRPDMLARAYGAGQLSRADLAYLAELGWAAGNG